MKRLKTKRLVLTGASDEELMTFMSNETDPHMKKAYEEMLALNKARPGKRLFSTLWIIALRDGTKIGSACFKGEPVNGSVEIGCGIDEAHRREGFGEEAVKALCDWAFIQDDVYFIDAETENDNEASRRLLEKCGYKPSGEGREAPGNVRMTLEKPQSALMAVFMCLGISMGISIGMCLDSIALGMCIGVGAGAALGAALDAQDRKKCEEYRKKRAQ